MSLTPCLRCGQPIGEDEEACRDCGQPRNAAPPPPPPPPAPPEPPAVRSTTGPARYLAFGALTLAAYAGWRRIAPRVEAPPTRPAVSSPRADIGPAISAQTAPAASSAAAAVPVAAAPSSAGAGRPEDEEAELPPAPTDFDPKGVAIYGVVYDLATKGPIGRARITFLSRMGRRIAMTDEHGWYRMDLPPDASPSVDVGVSVAEPRHRLNPLQESEPPLASRSDAERHTIAEMADPSRQTLTIHIGKQVPLAELDLALIPRTWPPDMAPAESLDAFDPPIPDEPDERTCRYYGVVYDLASKKPIARQTLVVTNATGMRQAGATTDGFGRYLFDAPVAGLEEGYTVNATVPGHRAGLLPERDPPMLLMSAKQRRDIADVTDLAFDPSELPSDCDDGLIRLDYAAVPERWPQP